MITPQCSRSGPSGTVTWAAPAPRWPADCTRCCGLVPGGVTRGLTAAHAARVLAAITPASAVDQARRDLADGFVDDLRRLDAQLRDTRNKLAAAVRASGTSLTGLFGVGPVIAHHHRRRPGRVPLPRQGPVRRL